MATKPKRWPNGAKESRDLAAEQAADALKVLEPLLDDRSMTREEVIARIAKVMNCLQRILRLLEKVGAQTRP